VEIQNFESMTKKNHQKWSKNFSETVGEIWNRGNASLPQGGWTPLDVKYV